MRYARPAATAVLILSAVAGCTSTRAPNINEPLPRHASRRHHGERVGPPAPVRLRLDVYMLPDGTKDDMRFSVEGLEDKAGDPETLLDALNVYGKAELPYRFDQGLDLGVKTELALVQEVPNGMGATRPSDGQSEGIPAYWDAGCVVDVSGTWGEAGSKNVADVRLAFTFTWMMDLGHGIKAPIIPLILPRESTVRVSNGVPALLVVLNPGPRFNDMVQYGCVLRLQVDRLEKSP